MKEKNYRTRTCEITCRQCEYLDYRGVDIARATETNTGYICIVKGHGTSTDKCACPCYLQAGTELTPKEKLEELSRIERLKRGLMMRKPRRKTHKQEQQTN